MESLDELDIRDLEAVTDDLLLPWLDLFETAFPPPERVLVSAILGILRDKASGLAQSHHLLAALEPPGQFVGMAWYELWPKDVALLGYIAVVAERRGQGIGTRFYREIVQRLSARVLAAAPACLETDSALPPAWRTTPDGRSLFADGGGAPAADADAPDGASVRAYGCANSLRAGPGCLWRFHLPGRSAGT
jgi:GNAT superfamily N-acetyltransferase